MMIKITIFHNKLNKIQRKLKITKDQSIVQNAVQIIQKNNMEMKLLKYGI